MTYIDVFYTIALVVALFAIILSIRTILETKSKK